MTRGKLFLLPNLLGDLPSHCRDLPVSVDEAVEQLDGLIAESEKAGRRFLSRFSLKKRAHEIPLALFNKHHRDVDFALEPMIEGETWGYVSDAGLPCIADPGAELVRKARKAGVTVEAFVGPSSILLALMQSGLSGQCFQFHGYPPKTAEERKKFLSKQAQVKGTHIIMEAPHRNQAAFESLLSVLPETALLCLAWDLTLPTQRVLTETIKTWKSRPHPKIDKRPALFLFQMEG